MVEAVRELGRAFAWLLFYLAAGSLLNWMHQHPTVDEQARIVLIGSLCFYGWWRLK